MLTDPNLTNEEKTWVMKFTKAVEDRLSSKASGSDITMFLMCDQIGLDVNSLHKDGILMYALWIALLAVLKRHKSLSEMKYPNMDSFLSAYRGRFDEETDVEKNRLWHTANWMSVLFTYISARKNKGLAMVVVPKLVEGWDAKYVTGSGQTRLTANRVHIFETEGNTKASHRGKAKAKAPVKAVKPMNRRARQVKKDPVPYTFAPPTGPMSMRTSTNRKRRYEDTQLAMEDPPTALQQDVKKAFSLLRDNSFTSLLKEGVNMHNIKVGTFAGPELVRNASNNLNGISLTGPSEFQRGVSWTEIPVASLDSLSSSLEIPAGYEDIAMSALPCTPKGGYEFQDNVAQVPMSTGNVLNEASISDIFAGYQQAV